MKYTTIICTLSLVGAVICDAAKVQNASPASSQLPLHRWTWVHRATFMQKDYDRAGAKGDLRFTKEGVAPFTQLIFSWNALRPKKGHFAFRVQVRDTKTKRWGTWHHVADWGATIQRSYASKSDGVSKNVHVRHELEPHMTADAFRVKVAAHDGASLKLVKGVAAAVSDFTNFKHEDAAVLAKLLPSVNVRGLLGISQFALDHPDNERICSAVSATILASHITKGCFNPYDFATGVFDSGLDAYGSWPFSTAHAFDRCAGRSWFFPRRLNSFQQLHQQLVRGVPVVVSVRGPLDGAPRPYLQGHILVVRGWDAKKKKVICHDSAFDTHAQTVCGYDLASFLRAWERSHRLVYWAEPIAHA